MATFVWCSQGTLESAALLAKRLKCQHGTVPPKDFRGDLVCLGAAPDDKFNWAGRTLGYIANDPRKYRKFSQGTQPEAGSLLRVFLVDGNIVKVSHMQTPEPGKAAPAVPAFNQATRAAIASLHIRYERPEFVAFDVAYSPVTGGVVLLKAVFGPALEAHPDVVDQFATAVSAKTQKGDKETLLDLINAASPEEAKALRNLLSTLTASTD